MSVKAKLFSSNGAYEGSVEIGSYDFAVIVGDGSTVWVQRGPKGSPIEDCYDERGAAYILNEQIKPPPKTSVTDLGKLAVIPLLLTLTLPACGTTEQSAAIASAAFVVYVLGRLTVEFAALARNKRVNAENRALRDREERRSEELHVATVEKFRAERDAFSRAWMPVLLVLLMLGLPACGTGMRALRQPAAEHEVQLVEVFESCFDESEGPGEGRCTRQNATIAIVQACLVTEAANLRSEERCMKMLEGHDGDDNE